MVDCRGGHVSSGFIVGGFDGAKLRSARVVFWCLHHSVVLKGETNQATNIRETSSQRSDDRGRALLFGAFVSSPVHRRGKSSQGYGNFLAPASRSPETLFCHSADEKITAVRSEPTCGCICHDLSCKDSHALPRGTEPSGPGGFGFWCCFGKWFYRRN